MLKRYQLLHRNQAEAFLISVPPILSRAIGFFLIPVYTRILSPAEFGLVSVALAISGVIRLIVLPGIDAVYMRYGFDGYGTPEAKRGHHFGTILRTHLLLLFVFFPVAAIPGIYLAKLSAPDVPITFFLIAVLSTALGSLQAPVIARFTATRQMKRVAAREFTMAALIATGSLTALLGLKWGAVSLLVGELSAALLMIPVSLKDVFSGLSKSHPWRGESVKTVVKSMVSIGPEALMVLSLTSVDRFFLNAVAGPTETGLYVAGYQIGSMVMALVIIAARQWRMIFYQLYFQDKNLNPAIGRQIYRGSFEVFLAITGMLAVLSQPIAYYVLGPKFQMSAQIIPIAVLIAFLRVPMTFVSIYLDA